VAPQVTQFCSKTIVLPLEESEYLRFVVDNEFAQSLIEAFWSRYPELFPIPECEFSFYGRTLASKKCEGMRLRRIKVQGCIYRIRPSFLLSYFRGQVAQTLSVPHRSPNLQCPGPIDAVHGQAIPGPPRVQGQKGRTDYPKLQGHDLQLPPIGTTIGQKRPQNRNALSET
jgi:hypothetical protein